MNVSPRLVISLCAAVTLALTLWLFSRPDPVRPGPVAAAANALPAADQTRPAAWEVEPQVEYAPRMPTGPGIAVVDGNGNLVGDAVLVAVPDSFGQLQYLPKSDPRAIRYDADQQTEHARVVQDDGPREVDTRHITMKNSVTARNRSVPISRKP